MPAFAFDDTKFRALIHMLDVLGQRNRDKLREVWDQRGFNPQTAVKIHCSQCHGEFLQGNGPVAEWIYPIPKNLRDAVFLRNLNKERAVYSIIHGVNGTPMSPWGEVAAGKEMRHPIPVLNETEIQQIVDWLFSDLPGEKTMPAKGEVLKWNYEPQDILKELRKEGDIRKLEEIPKPPKQNPEPSTARTFKGPIIAMMKSPLQATEIPASAQKAEEGLEVQDVFDVVLAHTPGPDKDFYFIKQKYYTKENLAQGEQLFVANCSICHGKDADGAGLRAASMQDAKPRMLTNLDWIETRDDLRLLRSIKYGVPGTGMTPWSDFTSAWQRMELVMYIRSLSQDKKNQDDLNQALYQSFNHVLSTIEEVRSKEYVHLQKLQKEYDNIHSQRETLAIQAQNSAIPDTLMIQDYQNELQILSQLNIAKSKDERFVNISSLIRQEREFFKNLGSQLIGLYGNGTAFQDFLQIVKLNRNFGLDAQGQLIWTGPQERDIEPLIQKIVQVMNERIVSLQAQHKAWQEKNGDDDQQKKLKEITDEITSNEKARRAILSSTAEIEPLMEQQKQLYNKIKDSHE